MNPDKIDDFIRSLSKKEAFGRIDFDETPCDVDAIESYKQLGDILMSHKTKSVDLEFDEEKYGQIKEAIGRYIKMNGELQARTTWVVGMLLCDHLLKHQLDAVSHKQFVKRSIRRLARAFKKEASFSWLNEALECHLAYPLLEELMIDRWVKDYDIREYIRLRPELVRGRDKLVGRVASKIITEQDEKILKNDFPKRSKIKKRK